MYRELTEGKCSYRGRSPKLRVSRTEKSAEVIVLCGNEPMNKAEDSQTREGLNVNWISIRTGLSVKRYSHLKRNQEEQSVKQE